MRARLAALGLVGFIGGGCVTWAMSLGYVRVPDPALNDAAFAAAGIAFLYGIAYLLLDYLWSSFRKRFPTRGYRAQVEREAERLALRSVEAENDSIDRSFPLLGGPGVSAAGWWAIARVVLSLAAFSVWFVIALVWGVVLAVGAPLGVREIAFIVGSSIVLLGSAAALGDWPGWFRARFGRDRARPASRRFTTGARRPGRGRISQVFTGRWNELEVRVFDYAHSDPETELTCALLPLAGETPEVEITPETITSGVARALGQNDLTTGDEEFDHAFRVLADREDEVRRMLNATVRARLMAYAPRFGFILQLRGRGMLYCVPQVGVASRGALLDAAKRLHEVLPVNQSG